MYFLLFPLESLTKTSTVCMNKYYSVTIVWVNSSFCHSYTKKEKKKTQPKKPPKQNKAKLFFKLEGVSIDWIYLIPPDGKDFLHKGWSPFIYHSEKSVTECVRPATLYCIPTIQLSPGGLGFRGIPLTCWEIVSWLEWWDTEKHPVLSLDWTLLPTL